MFLFFSRFLNSRLRDVQMEVDNLVSDSIEADVRVHNTFNDLLMLSDTQFIENRIYDEEVVRSYTVTYKR